jgi:cytochrome c5
VWYDRRMFAALRYQALAAALATAALVLVSGADSRVNRSAVRASAAEPQAPADSVASEEDVRAQCGVCHAVPPPDVLPRSAWRESVARMMLIRDGLPEPVGPAGTAARMVPLSP